MDEIFKKLKKRCNVIRENQNIFIWGAGNTALLYASALRDEGIQPVAFVDNHVKINNSFLGKPIISPTELRKQSNKGIVLICSQNPYMVEEISRQIENDIKIPYLTVNEYIFFRHMDEIKKCSELLSDGQSKNVYEALIKSWLESKFPPHNCYNPMQYFAHERFMQTNASEVFVDLGAFVGDTIERFLFAYDGVFKKIIAFEIDPRNFDALTTRMQRLEKEWAIKKEQVKLIRAGAGRKTSVMRMEQAENGLASKVSEDGSFGDNDCQIYALDDYFQNEKITFLKADIESFEYDTLLGSEKIIRRDLPKMAISIYHNPLDMFRIILWVDSLRLGYKFSVRHHSVSFADTVMYAYV